LEKKKKERKKVGGNFFVVTILVGFSWGLISVGEIGKRWKFIIEGEV